MKKILFILLAMFSVNSFAVDKASSVTEKTTPTASLQVAVNELLAIAGNKSLNSDDKKAKIINVVQSKMDIQVLSQRVVSRYWKEANTEDKKTFMGLFSKVVVNTYYSLLNKYTNEKINYLKEQIKKKKYAFIDTEIVMSDKTIPVTYKLIFRKNQWRIYDFSAEGISMVSTYKNDYKSTLKSGGLAGLNKILTTKLTKKN